MRKINTIQDVQLMLNTINDRLDSIASKAPNLNGRQTKNAGNATDPQDYVTLSQVQNLDLGTMTGKLQKHQIESVSGSAITGNINATAGQFNSLAAQQLTISNRVLFATGSQVILNAGNFNFTNGASISCDGFITARKIVTDITFNVGDGAYLVLYPAYPVGSGAIPPIPNPNPWGIISVSGLTLPLGYGQIRADSILLTGGFQGNILSQINTPGLFIAGAGGTTSLTFGALIPQAGFRYSGGLQWSPDNSAWVNFPTNKLYAEFTGTTQTFTSGAGFSNITSLSLTANLTGTWHLLANVLEQQASAAANSISIRFAKNGSGDVRTALTSNGPQGSGMLHLDFLVSLNNADVITIQCSAGGANGTVLGSGDQAMTNISLIYMGS